MCRSWLERQQNCPTCRASVIAPSPASQAPRGQAGAPAAAGDPAAPAGVSAAEAPALVHCPIPPMDPMWGWSTAGAQVQASAAMEHALMANNDACRSKAQSMFRGWRLMWWPERTCTGPMQRCVSAVPGAQAGGAGAAAAARPLGGMQWL